MTDAERDSDVTRRIFAGVRFPKDHRLSATLSDREYLAHESQYDAPTQQLGPFDDTSKATPALDLSALNLTLRDVLGEGGMGRVLLAEQQSLGRDVAVKVLQPHSLDARHVEMLLFEARTMGSIEHPNIVPVHLLGAAPDGQPVLVMKRVEGVLWSTLVHSPSHPFWKKIPLFRGDTLETHLGILVQVCNALQFAHNHRILHRDVKPDNVMVGAFGEVYLMDWGLATHIDKQKNTRESARWTGPVGTPLYMAPEMVHGEKLDERTDVFLLGAVLHEILTGNPRHQGSGLIGVLAQAMAPRPVAYGPEVPGDLAELANKSTLLDRAQRPASVAAFREVLADHLSHRGSIQLAATAHEILMTLESQHRNGTVEPASFERLLTECRFGFRQAMREWAGNLAARDGLQSLLALMIRRAIDRGDFEAVDGLIADLPTPDLALAAEADSAKIQATAKREAQLRASRIAEEMDLASGTRQRQLFFGMMTGGAILWNLGFLVLSSFGYKQFSHRSIIVIAVLLCALILGVTQYASRTLFRTVINRRLARLPLVGVGFELVHRLLGVWRGDSVQNIVADDLMIFSVVSLTAATLLRPAYLLTAAVFFTGGIVAMIHPAWTQPCFTIFGAMGLLSIYLLWLRTPGSAAG